jgi:hypothetical protein
MKTVKYVIFNGGWPVLDYRVWLKSVPFANGTCIEWLFVFPFGARMYIVEVIYLPRTPPSTGQKMDGIKI